MFRVMDDATCKFWGLGQGTDPLYICPNQFQRHLSAQPVLKWAITVHGPIVNLVV